MIDHAHFQYNGIALSFVYLAIAALLTNRPHWATFAMILVCFSFLLKIIK